MLSVKGRKQQHNKSQNNTHLLSIRWHMKNLSVLQSCVTQEPQGT